MPSYSVSESNSAATSTVTASVAPGSGTFAALGVTRAGTTSTGVGQPLLGTYGTLVLNTNGSFTYQLNNSDADTNVLGTGMIGFERFTYTYSLNGVVATASLTFNVAGLNEPRQAVSNISSNIVTDAVAIGGLQQVFASVEYAYLMDAEWGQPINFLNNGAVIAQSSTATSAGIGFWDFHHGAASVVNNGLISVTGGSASGLGNNSLGPVVNNGVIRVVATRPADPNAGAFAGDAYGIGTYFHGETVINSGTIDVHSAHGYSIGIWSRSLGTYIENSGLIYVSSGSTSLDSWITGIHSGQSADVVINNSGTIHVVSTAGLPTTGIRLFPDSTNVHEYGTIINSGTIVADNAITAVEGYSTGMHVFNSGRIEGDLWFNKNLNIVTNAAGAKWTGNLQLGYDHDVVVNAGTISGDVRLDGGNDLFDGRGGSVGGTVDAGAGLDLLYGGANADTLSGGDGDDRILGGGGADTLTGGAGSDIFIYGPASDSTAALRDTLIGFQSGVDKIDLTQLGATHISLTASGAYTILSATAPSGTLSIRVQGVATLADIMTNAPLGSQNGTSGNDILQAVTPNAVLSGGAGDDVLHGSPGGDLIDGGTGADTMYGGAGDDIYYVEDGGDRIIELDGPGVDEVRSWIDYSLHAFAENITLLGSANIGALGNGRANVIIGNSGENALSGDNGNDLLHGGGGRDTMSGGGGADVFLYTTWSESTAAVSDWIRGFERGADKIDISALSPLSITFTPFVNYWSSSDWTTVNVETASGTLVFRVDGVFDHSDFITTIAPSQGTGGDDQMSGGASSDWLKGAAGADRLSGLAGSDTLDGGAGDDWLTGGAGADVLTGGAGVDRFYFSAAPSTGIDRISDFQPDDFIYLDLGVFPKLAAGLLSTAAFHELTIAETADHRILYDPYEGTIRYDADGNGTQASVVIAYVSPGTTLTAANFVAYSSTSTSTVVESSVSYTLGSGEDHLTLTGTSAINGTGNGADNQITGNVAANVLRGLAGNDRLAGNGGKDMLDGGTGADTMAGGAGNDTYVVDSAGDFVTELAGEGTDIVKSSVNHTLAAHVENLTLTGRALVEGIGNDLNNRITGNAGANILSARGGNDILIGGAGNDTLYGDDGNDTLEGGIGFDQLYGGAAADRFQFRLADVSNTSQSNHDVIQDFSSAQGDLIALDLIDANRTLTGNQSFTFLGSSAFTGVAGQLRFEQISGKTFVQGDTNGDGLADFWVAMTGQHNLAAGDILL